MLTTGSFIYCRIHFGGQPFYLKATTTQLHQDKERANLNVTPCIWSSKSQNNKSLMLPPKLEPLRPQITRILDTMRLVRNYDLKTMHELRNNWLDTIH